MKKIDILIAAGGKGKRSGLNYPKTLYEINGVSILYNLISKLKFIKKNPIIIVSKKGKKFIQNHLKKKKIKANYIIQKKQRGMGDALNIYAKSKNYNHNNHTLLVWGDLLYLDKLNIKKLIAYHLKFSNTLSLISGYQKSPYTLIKRNKNKLIKILETIEIKNKPKYGERDTGIFLFNNRNCKKYFSNIKYFARGKMTKEIKFLNIIEKLVKDNHKVEAYKLASAKEMMSFNYPSDIKRFVTI